MEVPVVNFRTIRPERQEMRDIHTLAHLTISKPGTPSLKGRGKICFYTMERTEYFSSPKLLLGLPFLN